MSSGVESSASASVTFKRRNLALPGRALRSSPLGSRTVVHSPRGLLGKTRPAVQYRALLRGLELRRSVGLNARPARGRDDSACRRLFFLASDSVLLSAKRDIAYQSLSPSKPLKISQTSHQLPLKAPTTKQNPHFSDEFFCQRLTLLKFVL